MSSGLNCDFVQAETEKWYYVLEDYNAPKHSWDWHAHAQACGPFLTEDVANEHLRNNHSNPGGSSTYRLPEGVEKMDLSKDPLLANLIGNAEPPEPPEHHSRRFSYRYR